MKLIRIFLKVLSLISIVFVTMVSVIAISVSHYLSLSASKAFTVADTMVQIPYGSSLRRVSEILHTAGIIDSPGQFYWYLRLGRNDADKIQAGFYRFLGTINQQHVAVRLLFGRDQSYKVTFKEGQTLIDLVNTLESIALVTKDDFQAAMTSGEVTHLINAPNVSLRKNLENDVGGIEGYLFPDTYFFTKKDSAVSIIKKMHARLLEVFNDEMKARLTATNRSLHEILTLASIIEKETGAPKERPIIASVYHNRLNKGMRLQADPTVIYGIKNYQGKIAKTDLLTHHAYNTYTIKALPPGPIAAPGRLAIHAALWPDTTNYLYFVSRNDGTHIFCENLVCHNAAVRRWQIDYFKKVAQ